MVSQVRCCILNYYDRRLEMALNKMIIREEKESDRLLIRDLVTSAFAGKAFSDGTEADVIDRLRQQQALSLSLVAIDEEKLLGHVCFSPASISSGLGVWYALGPIAVIPEKQGLGIGGALIKQGLAVLREKKAWGCILVGDPVYYSRYGFRLAPEYCPDDEPKKNFQLYGIDDHEPDGIFSFHKAFYSA